jgi:hypothetical protein
MLIKVLTAIIIEVEGDGDDAAESASATLDGALANNLRQFPDGDVVAANVDHWERVSDQEAESEGWTE